MSGKRARGGGWWDAADAGAWGAGLLGLFAAERERWPLWLPVGFGAGIALYFALPAEPPAGLALAVAVAALLLAAAGYGLAHRGKGSQWMVVGALAVAVAAAGFATARWHAARAAAPVLERRIGPVSVEGRVIAIEPGLKGARVTLEDPAVSRLAPESTPARVRLRLSGDAREVGVGDTLRVTAILLPPPAPSAPGAYDFARDAWFRKLGGVGFAFGTPEVTARAGEGEQGFLARARNLLSETRRALHLRISKTVGGTNGAVASALMTGERGAIPPEAMEDMRASGLAHLLAISGLHIGLVTGALFFGLRALLAAFPGLALHHPIKKWAASVALVGGAGYMLITGATVPTQRAFLMAGLVFVAVMVDRAAISMRLVAWAAALVLLAAPESLTGPSFQMSFAAVIALVAVYESARGGFSRLRGEGSMTRRAFLYVAGVALTTLVAGLATAPFAVYHFNRVAAFGLAANLGAVPITALWIMPWSVLAYLLAPLGLDWIALAPMGWGIGAVLWIARTVAAWPGAALNVPEMPVAALALASLGGLWLALWRTRLRLAGIALLAAGIIVGAAHRPPDLLVDGAARSFAVRGPEGRLLFAGAPPGRFEREVWLRRAGLGAGGEGEDEDMEEGTAAVPEGALPMLTCDASACIYRARGRVVSLIRDPGAALEDCARVDVVVALVPLRRVGCRGPARVIGRFDLWREGAHAVWLGPGIRVESVARARGRRPWAPGRGRD